MGDDELVIPGSRRKAVLLLLIALGLVSGGVFLILHGEPFGWVVGGFFALGIPVSLFMLRPKSSYLKLDRDGVEIARPFKPFRLKWTDVEGFYIVKMYGLKFIGIHYTSSYDKETARKLAAAISGGIEGALPNHFRGSPEEICEKLNRWRRRSLGLPD
jgi:hypothetical protein